jgi:hypothetical protein
MAKKKKITVVRQKRPKKPKKSKKAKKAKKGKKGKGQFGNFFPTNRQIDSNQYWQLRAEIAGAEARVRTSLKDRQEDEKKADKKVAKLETEVKDFTKLSAAQQRQNFSPVGTPDRVRGDAEYDRGDVASRSRSRRSGSSARTPEPRRSRSLSPSGLSRSASAALDPEDHASRALHSRSRSPSPAVNPGHGPYGAIGVSGSATPRGQPLRRSPEGSGIGTRIPVRERPRQATPAGARGVARQAAITALTALPPRPDEPESVIKRAERD